MNNLICFLGGSSPTGFRTGFDKMIADTDFHTYIIKGGPGTGKSSLMKRLAEAFPDEEKEIYYCSSDPDSLDAVIFSERKVIFVDGTPPHCFEPEYPGAVQQILDLGAYWNGELLKKNKEQIVAASADYLQYHARCRRYITALSAVMSDTEQIAEAALSTEKLDGFINRLAKKILPKKNSAEDGRIEFRQFSALGPKGYLTHVPDDYAAYLLNDRFYTGSERFLRKFSDIARKKGYTVSISVCTLHGEEFFEHMIIPELKIAFFSANPVNGLILAAKQPINFRRFYDKNIIAEKKIRIKFNESAAKNLLDEAISSLVNAKRCHDKLEEFYISAVDFDSINRILYTLISEVKAMNR